MHMCGPAVVESSASVSAVHIQGGGQALCPSFAPLSLDRIAAPRAYNLRAVHCSSACNGLADTSHYRDWFHAQMLQAFKRSSCLPPARATQRKAPGASAPRQRSPRHWLGAADHSTPSVPQHALQCAPPTRCKGLQYLPYQPPAGGGGGELDARSTVHQFLLGTCRTSRLQQEGASAKLRDGNKGRLCITCCWEPRRLR